MLAAFLAEGFAALVFILNASSEHISVPVAALGGAAIFAAILIAALKKSGPQPGGGSISHRGAGRAALWTAGGLVLRIAWVIAIPPVQTSDYLRYLQAGRNLLATHTYSEFLMGHTFRAFTPPGLPFFLAGGLLVFGDHSWMPAVLNCGLYLLSSVLVIAIARRAGAWNAAVLAAAIFAVWPSGLGLTGLAASEPLFVALFLLACFFVFLPEEASWGWAVAGGLAAGLATLTRPTALTLPALWAGAALLSASRPRGWRNALLATVALVAIVAPWSLRNYRVLGAFVPVSTNGGDVFYRANNPLATGSWTPKGERDLSPYLGNEVIWNKTGFAWGKEWIAKNPLAFLKLAVRKQYTFLGSDDTGAYWSIERPYPQWKTAAATGKVFSQIWWFALWVFALFSAIHWRREILRAPQLSCLLLPLLYFISIHSIFESQDRYHIPVVPFLIVIAVLTVGGRPRTDARPGFAAENSETRPAPRAR